MRYVGNVAHVGKRRMHTRFWWRRPERKRPFERPRLRRKDNIKIDVQEVGWGHDWIDLVNDRNR
jgi:hypothetical protein